MIRINDLAREIGVRSREILKALPDLGVVSPKKHSSSLKTEEAARIRMHFSTAAVASQSDILGSPVLDNQTSKTNRSKLRDDYIAKGLITPGGRVLDRSSQIEESAFPNEIRRAVGAGAQIRHRGRSKHAKQFSKRSTPPPAIIYEKGNNDNRHPEKAYSLQGTISEEAETSQRALRFVFPHLLD